ncbi:winged helix DNA-binding domain-containing protein [Nocardioides sp. GY 10127]|uniref:winged helix DNA-binding domain-containing protein n=1 Tax=Nocardioides sp. GY 10127 TaxID=2569762 RepID=UPI0010A8317E|nr:winged helix DNA-binding domain-containing protein [Nocardioides sp. GY 10127]TIC80757.1 winged helix DNA-binding domain-containing protein [Nocardioides sp. GY 10127]
MSRPRLDDEERRRRLARHGLGPAHRVGTVEEAVRAVVCLHATEAPTVSLSVHARVDGLGRDDVEEAETVERSVVRQLAMRRTMFVLPRDLLGATWGSAAARTAAAERAKLVKDVVRAGIAADGEAWMTRAEDAVLAALAAAPEGLTTVQLRAAAPEIDVRAELPSSQVQPGRVLTVLGAQARIVRGANTQHWRQYRPRWHRMEDWLGAEWLTGPGAHLAPADGYVELVRCWLSRFGPGTENDLVWWLGSTKGAVRAALVAVGAVEVDLEGGATGYVLPGDEPVTGAREPWAALLPVLDPTTMGWKDRAWYLGPHEPVLFDRNGNGGTTAWWDGRVVGCWVQDPDGDVEVRLLEDVGALGRAALAVEARRLTTWLAGERVSPIYRAPAMTMATADLPYPPVRA